MSAESWDSSVGSQEPGTRKLCTRGWGWPYLGLGESKMRCPLSLPGQGWVLRVLQTLVQMLQLQAGVDGSRSAQLPGQGLLPGLQGQRRFL